MSNLSTILLLTIVGGVIGWITNILAIKLMFRPINPIKIPLLNIEILGLIPKRKKEIAKNIGDVVANDLLSIDDLLNEALDDDSKNNITEHIKSKARDVANEKLNIIPAPFRMMVSPYVDDIINKEIGGAVENIGVDIISMAKDKININKIVEEKINELDLEELETIIISICKKEFKHIEILGLVLGGLIGLVQGLIVILL